MSGRDTPCRKSCCWTPFGTCAKHGNCRCHMAAATRAEAVKAQFMGVTIDELERRRKLRELVEGPDRKQGGGRWKKS